MSSSHPADESTMSTDSVALREGMLELSAIKQLSIADFEQRRLNLATTIFEKHEKLQTLWSAHAGLIWRRWNNKANTKRNKILKAVHPKIPETRLLPDFNTTDSFASELQNDAMTGVSSRHCPQINLTDLRRGNRLVEFIKARAEARPDQYMWVESENANFRGLDTGLASTTEQLAQRMRMWEQHNASDYGQIIPATTANDLDKELYTGLFVLQVQEYIMSFLVLCAAALSHNAHLETSSTSVAQGSKASGPITNSSDWPSLASLAAQAPFQAPELFKLRDADVLVSAQLSAELDKLFQLREDPEYYSRTVKAVGDDDRYQVMAEAYISNDLFDMASNAVVLKRLYRNIFYFSATQKVIRRLLDAQEKNQIFETSEKISPACEEDFAYLTWLLTDLVNVLLHDTSAAAAGLRAWLRLSSGFKIGEAATRGTFREHPLQIIDIKPQAGCDSQKLRVHNAFFALGDETVRNHYGLNTVIAAAQVVIDKDKDKVGQKHLSGVLIDTFGRLAVVAELDRQLRLFQPWISVWNKKNVNDFANAVSQHSELQDAYKRAVKVIREHCSLRGFKRADTRLAYPSASIDRATKTLRRKAEDNLEDFWGGLDDRLGHTSFEVLKTEDTVPSVDRARQKISYESVFIEHHQTTEIWIEKTEVGDHDSGAEVSSLPEQLGERLKIDAGEGTTSDKPRKPKVVEERSKEKTHGTAAVQQEEEEEELPPAEPTRVPIPLDNKAWTVKCYLLKEELPPGEVAFDDIVHFMVSAGFEATKVGGVEWTFQPQDPIWAQQGALPAHAPHPKPKFNASQLYGFARRLGRRYDMQVSDFVGE